MNPALPNTCIDKSRAGVEMFEYMVVSLAKVKFNLGIAKKGRAG